MTGIAAIVQKNSNRLNIETIIREMSLRGSEVVTQNMIGTNGPIEIGLCNYAKDVSLLQLGGEVFAIDGTSFDDLIATRIENHEMGLVSLQSLMQSPGAFSFLGVYSGRLILGRDPIGQKPLYYGSTSDGSFVCSSLRYPLVRHGAENVQPVPPGQIYTVSEQQLSPVMDATLADSHEESISEEEGLKELRTLFETAVQSTIPSHSTISFSGGLDSSLIAFQAKLLGLEPNLVTVGLKGQSELVHARKIAEILDLKIQVRELLDSEVLGAVARVAEIIESDDPTLLGISIPLYFACQMAAMDGNGTIVMGQLSDELFAGYGRFERMALRHEHELARKEIWNSVRDASFKDFDTGDKLAVSFGLQLRCPFAYLPLVQYGLKIPIHLKLYASEDGIVRKYILRKLATIFGLPETVSFRPKKAVQYSSGVQRLLVKEATRRGMSLASFIRSIVKDHLSYASIPLDNQ